MLYWLLSELSSHFHYFSAIESITLRTLLSVLTALTITLVLGKPVINKLHDLKYGQAVRTDGPETHLKKQGTPTMGGVLILLSIFISTFLWADLSNIYIWILFAIMIVFGAVGFADDWLKIKHKSPDGLSAKKKYFWLSVGSLGAGIAMYMVALNQPDMATTNAMQDVIVPVLKNWVIPLSSIPYGLGFIVLTYFAINGSSNAVNLTDGLDGLAILPVVMVACGLGIFAYVTGDARFADYLHIHHISLTSELTIVCAAMSGAGLGFLWFNAHPADVFMGDVGSLTLGAMLGTIAVMVRQELAYVIMAGIFVMEAVSVFMQVGYFRYSGGKRIFRMAPIHHHFEKKGWQETKVVVRFWVISIIMVVIGLMTLKIR